MPDRQALDGDDGDPRDARFGGVGCHARSLATALNNPAPVADSARVSARIGSFSELHGSTPLKPLLGFAALAAGAVAIYPQGSDWRFLVLAALVFAVSAAAVAVSPVRADSQWLPLVPAFSALLAIALLRQSQGGSTSGYSPLAILAVVWVAVVLDRRAVRLVTFGIALMFAVPLLLLGAPEYPSSGWRGATLWTLIAYVVGTIVQSAVVDQRSQAADARRHASQLEDMQMAFSAISGVARNVSLGADARQLVCAAVVSSTDARLATMTEPRGDGFAITGSAGIPIEATDLRLVQPAVSLAAYRTGQRIFIADVANEPGVSPVIVQATGIVSALYEPIIRGGEVVGVLCAAWTTPRDHLDARTQAVIQFLAAEAGAAIERADLLSRLDDQARTDPLTSLPNRRAWDATVTGVMQEARALCVAMIDIDHFKQFNDHHGHAAGDRLLRDCALAWKRHLRPSDTLARYGGEEFAVLLPDCSLEDATYVLERLRTATPSDATASVGVAQRVPGETATDVLARADSALYQAKDTGRDRLRAA
jgi:diguanylate cyclase (GGDEF)-like protein